MVSDTRTSIGWTPSAEAREHVLDAAESCLEHFGLAKTTIEDVAQAAGVSRATIYRRFRNRDELLVAVVGRDSERTAAEAEIFLQRFDDVGSWIVEGILFCLREIPRRPLLSQLLAPTELGTASRLVLSSESMLEIGADLLRPMFEPARRQGLLRESLEIDALIEWVLRILMSYLAVPSHRARGEQEMRHLVSSMILPAVLKDSSQPPELRNPLNKESGNG